MASLFTTDLDGLLAAIIADPQDNLARLAYADALEEQGQCARAEFIRVQVLHSPETWRPFGKMPPEEERLRSNWTLAMWWQGLCDQFPFLLEKTAYLERGFISQVTCRIEDWLKYGPAFARQQPLELVKIGGKKPSRGFDGCWRWYVRDGSRVEQFYEIPLKIWEEIDDGTSKRNAIFRDESDAIAALSRACITWARKEGKSS